MRTRSSKNTNPVDEEEITTFIESVEGETQCSVCAAEFLDEDDLKVHVKQMHSNETQGNTMCNFCGTFFSGLEEFVIHFIYSHLEKIIFCFYCYRGYMDPVGFAKHELKHYAVQDNPTITCSQCPQIFSNRYELQMHEFSTHRDSNDGVLLNHAFSLLSCALNIQITKFIDYISKNKSINCAVCNHCSSDITNYMEHLKITNCQNYTCDKCFRVYKTKNGVSNHFLSHPECQNYSEVDKQKQCLKCDKYIDISNFKEHKDSCRAEKCSTCKVIFNSVHELTEHRVKDHQVPLSITLQTCKYCKKELVGMYNLQKHINRAHKNCNLYKYPCTYCGIFYMHPSRLFAHYFTRHKDIYPYTCQICNIKFRLRKKFTIHIKLDHNSVGFVEFDEKLHVIFSDKKSEKPYQPPTPIIVCHDPEVSDNASTELLNVKKSSTTNKDNRLLDDEEKSGKKDASKVTNMVVEGGIDESIDDKDITTDTIDAIDTNSQGSDEDSLLKVRTDLIKENVGDDVYEKPLIQRRKRKSKIQQKSAPKKVRKSLIDKLSTEFSDDEPLSNVRQSIIKSKGQDVRGIGGKIRLRNKTAKLTCKICNKYCYTFQHYHHHMSLHEKSKLKRCVKCHECFKSRRELQCHIDRAHSSSKLTETLKFLLEKRKQNQQPAEKFAPRPAETLKSLLEQRKKTQLMSVQNSVSNKFRRTIRKVQVTDQCTATITPMSDHGLSVKNFIENFRPDGGDIVSISNSVTIKTIKEPVDKQSFIKMYKFNNEQPINDGKLCLPVKFTDNTCYPADSKSNVSVKLVQQLITKPKLLNFIVDEKVPLMRMKPEQVQNNEYCNTFADATDYTQYKNESTIPDVGHEVVMGDADDVPRTKQLAQEIIIPNIPEKYGGVRIGHLLPEAPYYKIVKVKKLLKAANPKEFESEEVPDNNIKLPDGTQLVTVKNPFSHLIPNEHLEEILKSYKNKYYTPKTKNIGKALVKALNNKKKYNPNGKRRKPTKEAKPEQDTMSEASVLDISMAKESMPVLLSEEMTLDDSVSQLNTPDDTIPAEEPNKEALSSGKSIKTDSGLQEKLGETIPEVYTPPKAPPKESITNEKISEESISNDTVLHLSGEPVSQDSLSREIIPEESTSGESIPEESITTEPVSEVLIPGEPIPDKKTARLSLPGEQIVEELNSVELISEDPIKEDSIPEEPIKEDSIPEEPISEDSVSRDPIKEESMGETITEQTISENSIPEGLILGHIIPAESRPGKPITKESMSSRAQPGISYLKFSEF